MREFVMRYNPIVRNFCRIRRVLVESLELPRRAIRPTATFAELVPRGERWRVWERFREEGIDVNPLGFTAVQKWAIFLSAIAVIPATALLCPINFALGAVATAMLPILVGCLVAYGLSDAAVEIDPKLTIGDATLAATTATQCVDAEYRFTRNEIFLKVRRIVAEAAGVDPEDVTGDTSFQGDLGLE
jgi:hypothetical protein